MPASGPWGQRRQEFAEHCVAPLAAGAHALQLVRTALSPARAEAPTRQESAP